MGNFGDEVVQCVVVDGGFSIEGGRKSRFGQKEVQVERGNGDSVGMRAGKFSLLDIDAFGRSSMLKK